MVLLDKLFFKLKGVKTLVATNGCFDILHSGHVQYLERARALGDFLLVGLNSDKSVKELKGPSRPINNTLDRAFVLASIQFIDGIYIFDELDACRFIRRYRPKIYVKGGDYTLETINQDERAVLEEIGSQIVIQPLISDKSSSKILEGIG